MDNRLPLRISLGLFLVVLAAYFPVSHGDFANYDDPQYVYSNTHVNTGLTRDNVIWAWTSFEAANWHPFTWMSHQLDCQLFDLRPHLHHVVNLGWHIANTIMLFLVLRRMTGEDWRPALVAALFGLHPLHVESVAWISERKDVTSTFFALLTLGMYTLYAARPSVGRYLGVLASFALGLLCKPMLVTWPFVLLLMDYWPLRRTPASQTLPEDRITDRPRFVPAGWPRLVMEKLPLLTLTAASSIVTMQAQTIAMKASEHLTLGFRLGNAVVSYATYLRKMVWPTDLAAFYRHMGTRLTLTPVLVSGIVLILLSLVALLNARRRPALLVGWLWYLGTLVPVIGIVQVGIQSMADRYTYIPLIGLFLALAWSIPSVPKSHPAIVRIIALASGGVLLSCAMLTFRQTQFWQGPEELWLRSVKVAENPVSHCFYAGALNLKAGKLFDEANELRRKGRTAEADRYIAEAEARMAEAEQQCRLALQMEPTFTLAYAQLGEYQIYRGDLEGALATLSEGISRDSDSAALYNRLGRALVYMDRTEEACQQFREACRLDTESAGVHFDLGTVLALLGDLEAARREWELGRHKDPEYGEKTHKYAESLLGRADSRRHCPSAAVFHAQEACWSNPTPQADSYQTLAEAHAAAGQPIAAYIAAQRALNLAENEGRTDLLPALRRITQSYEPLARQYELRVAALTVASPMINAFPGAMGTLILVQFSSPKTILSAASPLVGQRVNDR